MPAVGHGAGVLLGDELASSSRYVHPLRRSSVRGATGLPADGMQAIGVQLAARLGPGRVHPPAAVRSVRPGSVVTDDGTWRPDAVVVATDPVTAAGLLPAVDATAPRQVTTHLHVLPESPWPTPPMVLGQPGGRLVTMASGARAARAVLGLLRRPRPPDHSRA